MKIMQLIPDGENAILVLDEEMLRVLGNPKIGDSIPWSFSEEGKALMLHRIHPAEQR
jgi:hypothetical protein